MAINSLQEEGWGPIPPDAKLLRELMPVSMVDLLISTVEGATASESDLRKLAAVWSMGVHADHRMFVCIGHGGMRRWSPGTDWPPRHAPISDNESSADSGTIFTDTQKLRSNTIMPSNQKGDSRQATHRWPVGVFLILLLLLAWFLVAKWGLK
ncbi:hypothetical protein ACQEVF_20990 [Nonomuraea polychroma]|uniref:hypothetical protein n=1 Tax=Nonomuraea polychroma TaxID=46176 RepID=UPI003D8BF44E